MNSFYNILYNRVLLSAITAWFIAQVLKIFFTFKESKKFDITRLIGSGGMPSSHTSFVMALATSVGKMHGWDSTVFAIALSFAFVVMYDAAGVRRAAGNQAKVLNMIIQDLAHHKHLGDERLKELLGHTPKEVLAGALLGIIIANIFIR